THGALVDETVRPDGKGPWLTEYDRTKWAAHYEVAEPMIREGLPLVIVEPGVNYGPGDTSEIRPLLVRYLRRRLRALPKETAYCWAHVDDTARGHLLAMEKGVPGETYILAGPPHSLIEAFQIAERITGIRPPRLNVSPRLLRLRRPFPPSGNHSRSRSPRCARSPPDVPSGQGARGSPVPPSSEGHRGRFRCP